MLIGDLLFVYLLIGGSIAVLTLDATYSKNIETFTLSFLLVFLFWPLWVLTGLLWILTELYLNKKKGGNNNAK